MRHFTFGSADMGPINAQTLAAKLGRRIRSVGDLNLLGKVGVKVAFCVRSLIFFFFISIKFLLCIKLPFQHGFC